MSPLTKVQASKWEPEARTEPAPRTEPEARTEPAPRTEPAARTETAPRTETAARKEPMIRYRQSSALLAVIFWHILKELRSKASDAQNAETFSKQSRIHSVLSLGS